VEDVSHKFFHHIFLRNFCLVKHLRCGERSPYLGQALGTVFGLQLIEAQECGGCVPQISSPKFSQNFDEVDYSLIWELAR
jgi:hypothetical protein